MSYEITVRRQAKKQCDNSDCIGVAIANAMLNWYGGDKQRAVWALLGAMTEINDKEPN